MSEKLKLGWAEVDMTPDRPVYLAGQFYERISEYVETPLTVTALAIEADGEQAVICSCDIVAISEDMVARVRKLLEGRTDLPLEKVMIGAIHSHTSIEYNRNGRIDNSTNILLSYAKDGGEYVSTAPQTENVLTQDEATPYIAEKIAEAVINAWNARKPAQIAHGFGRAAVGMCRRACYDDGTALMWGDTNTANFTQLEGGNDSGIEILYTFDENRKITGVVANVACPAQVLEHRSFISSDYWGKVKQFLREKFGDELKVLGLCSAAGDQCPRDLIRWVEPETPVMDPNINHDTHNERWADPSMFDIKGCTLAGRRVANEILYAYEDITDYYDTLPFEHHVLTVDLPIRRVTGTQYRAADRAIREFFDEAGGTINYKDNAKLYIYAGDIARYRYQQTHDILKTEVHVMRLGDIAFATNPFELFLDYGNQIRARSAAKQTFLVQLCCGAEGYLPTEKAEKGSHYSAYVSSGICGHIGGEQLVRKTVQEINDLFEK